MKGETMTAIAEYAEVMREANVQVATLCAQIAALVKELEAVRRSRDFWRDAYQKDIAPCSLK